MFKKILVLVVAMAMMTGQAAYAGTIKMSAIGSSNSPDQGRTMVSITVDTTAAGPENDQYVSNSARATILIHNRLTGKRISLRATGMVQAVPEDASRQNGTGIFSGISDPDRIPDSGDELSVNFRIHQNWYLTGKKTYNLLIEKSYPLSPAYEKIFEAVDTELNKGNIRVIYSDRSRAAK